MNTVGIIAEYNPLHNGHIYHVEKAKELSNAENCIVALSGNFVQRGEPACMDKFTRASWAIRSKADFVFEIPVSRVLSSAEKYAFGGIKTLISTGIVTHIAFGCETENITGLFEIADILSDETGNFRDCLRNNLKTGVSYPRAMYEALIDYGVPESLTDILKKPNNILAAEYLRILKNIAQDIIPVPIIRNGSDYNDNTISSLYPSATAVREILCKNETESIKNCVPSFIYDEFIRNPSVPVKDSDFSDILLYLLHSKTHEELKNIPDVSEGIENLILKKLNSANTYEELLYSIKSKRYTMARLKRICMNILLQIKTESNNDAAFENKDFKYLHLLAMNKSKKGILSEISNYASDGLIVRSADTEKCNSIVQQFYKQDAYSTDIYNIICPYNVHKDCYGPIIV